MPRPSKRFRAAAFLALAITSAPGARAADSPGDAAAVIRSDHAVPGDPGIVLFVREVRPREPRASADRPPILLLHGARAPAIAPFDLPLPNGSLAPALAAAGGSG